MYPARKYEREDGGPDAHAKNYSLLLAGPTVRMAPRYDISSVAPYPDRFDLRTMAMAMSVNGKYRNSLVTGEDWRALARATDIDPEQMTSRVHDVVSNAPEALAEVVREEADWITELEMTHRLVDGVAATSKQLLRWVQLPELILRAQSGRSVPDTQQPARRRSAP